jgi:carbonic anhydrase/acetyltransferase-like protein (isoleucine patch superfamily)
MIHAYQGITPRLHPSVFVADGAHIVGDVEIGIDSSVWFNTVIRGDVHFIRIGSRTNIQDGCVLHVTAGVYPLVLGSDITVGHGAILHGCTVEDSCLIGMGVTVLDNARIGARSLVAAGSLVRENFQIPPGSLVAGVPATVKRPLTDEEEAKLAQGADNYLRYVKTYRP